MSGAKSVGAMIGFLAALVIGYSSFYVVDETEMALVLRLGEIVDSDSEPGLHTKLPFVQNVELFDKRIQALGANPQRFLTSEKKFVVVDSYVKWRISDVAQYYRSTRGDIRNTRRLLSERINSALRDEFGKRTIVEVVSGERAEIMRTLAEQADQLGADIGVEVVDVRIKKIDFPPEVSNQVYERMRTERERVARELRAQGAEKAERIEADAERQKTEILANAYRDAEKIRGEGDAKSAETYAGAFAQDEEFYAFWRSLSAYRKVFENGDTLMVLDPDSEFFRYLQQRDGG